MSATDPTRFIRGVGHNVANAAHCALEAILLSDGCHRAKAGGRLREDRECLYTLKGQMGSRRPLLFDLGHPFCQRVENLLGVDRLGPQWRGSGSCSVIVLVASSI